MRIKLQFKVKLYKDLLIQQKESTFSYWIVVDQWEDQECQKQNKLWCFSLKVYPKIHISMLLVLAHKVNSYLALKA